MDNDMDVVKLLSARPLVNQLRASPPLDSLSYAEFKVFSQFGDDGIIQYLIHRAKVQAPEQCFIEFGVENYEESNTRFLLMNDNWKGLVIDGDARNTKYIMRDRIYWHHDLTAVCSFINADNINHIIERAGFSGDIGLLSIDIDGNDYWILEKISCVHPVLLVVEYNSIFGGAHPVTVPYDPTFQRRRAHFSNLYWGCSIAALEILASRKGFALVGSNSAGNNAYFVRRDRLFGMRELTAIEAYVESHFRESRDPSGALSYLRGNARLRAIREMPIVDLRRDELVRIDSLYEC